MDFVSVKIWLLIVCGTGIYAIISDIQLVWGSSIKMKGQPKIDKLLSSWKADSNIKILEESLILRHTK